MKLIPIDLSKGDEHHHPDIKTDGTPYLILYFGSFAAGIFHEQWYGLNFQGGVAWNCQFDTPGSNGDTEENPRWQGIWEIVDDGETVDEDVERRR